MPLFQLFLVAALQGLTEFLPISSSGHLILLPNLTGLQDQGQVIDVAVHIGTLFAVCIYFWKEVLLTLRGFKELFTGKTQTEGAQLAKNLVIATIPVVIVGLIMKLTGTDEALRSVAVIGWTMLGFGLLLYWFDQKGSVDKGFKEWSLKQALILGLWQAVALIPGTSRSGITITGARAMGFDRESAARISMLMSIPTILASGTLLTLDVISTADMQVAKDGAIAAAFAFIAALFALSIMMRLLKSVSYTPYVIYRVILGILLLWYAYS